jgi:serine/threonine-protein kinase HipA
MMARHAARSSFRQEPRAHIRSRGNAALSGVQIRRRYWRPMARSSGHRSAIYPYPQTGGTAGFEMLPIVEWLCLQLGRAAGFAAPDVALTAMPDGMAPALVVERFDIRQGRTIKGGSRLRISVRSWIFPPRPNMMGR